ncbi:hypothetical protein D3C72_1530130 [compost metagenome]
MAASISRSPCNEPAALLTAAYPATMTAPSTENSQNRGRGRSPPLSTAKTAVLSGSKPTKTMECAEVTCCNAIAVNSGKPTTPPMAVRIRENRSAFRGLAWRNSTSRASASPPAIVARAAVRKIGSKSATATRVAGREPAKIATPIRPFTQPFVTLSIKHSLLDSQ